MRHTAFIPVQERRLESIAALLSEAAEALVVDAPTGGYSEELAKRCSDRARNIRRSVRAAKACAVRDDQREAGGEVGT